MKIWGKIISGKETDIAKAEKETSLALSKNRKQIRLQSDNIQDKVSDVLQG
jgi:hypothetical protein